MRLHQHSTRLILNMMRGDLIAGGQGRLLNEAAHTAVAYQQDPHAITPASRNSCCSWAWWASVIS